MGTHPKLNRTMKINYNNCIVAYPETNLARNYYLFLLVAWRVIFSPSLIKNVITQIINTNK